jgi:hypothetical protein
MMRTKKMATKEHKGHKDGGELTANHAKYANGKEAEIEQKQTKGTKTEKGPDD